MNTIEKRALGRAIKIMVQAIVIIGCLFALVTGLLVAAIHYDWNSGVMLCIICGLMIIPSLGITVYREQKTELEREALNANHK